MIKFGHSFCVLASELHFGRAAARLHITQPALTHQIKTLESEIGCSLLRRSSHQVTLTEAGTVLARELGAALEQVDRAVQAAVDVARGDAGALAIGYCELPFAGGLAGIVQRFVALYPRIEVSLRTLPTNQQAEALLTGSIDIGFLHPPLEAARLTLRPAGEERVLAVLPRSHPLAQRTSLRLMDLASEWIICCSDAGAPHMHQALLAACVAAGFNPLIREEDSSWHAMINQAAAGLGVALAPETLVHSTAPHVVFLPVVDLPLRLQTAIATLEAPMRPAVARFLALCVE